jgi:hypothetical protein
MVSTMLLILAAIFFGALLLVFMSIVLANIIWWICYSVYLVGLRVMKRLGFFPLLLLLFLTSCQTVNSPPVSRSTIVIMIGLFAVAIVIGGAIAEYSQRKQQKELTDELYNSIKNTNNHETIPGFPPDYPPYEPTDDPDCFCTRCCAIRLLYFLEHGHSKDYDAHPTYHD